MIEIRNNTTFLLVSPSGKEEELTSSALQGMRTPEIELINTNLEGWVGLTDATSPGNIIDNLARVLIVARSDVAARAMPRDTEGHVLPSIAGAVYEEVEEGELVEFAELLYRHIFELSEFEDTKPRRRRWPFGRR